MGETLTASTGGITDPDGLASAAFSYQWSRDDGSTITGISRATAATYTLQEEDLDLQVSVTVSFTDDAGNDETLTSAAVHVQPPTPLSGAFDSATLPSEHDGSNTFTFELYFSEEPDLGYEAVRDHVLDVTNGDVTSVRRTTQGSNLRWEITVQPDGNDEVTLLLPITANCDDDGAVCTGSEKKLLIGAVVFVRGPATSQEQTDANTPATGNPAVTGTAQVGQTLTADTSGIADADGLQNATFSHQWVSSDEVTDTDIPGETGATYVVKPGDAGKMIKVRVSFTDDGGNDETLTSEATAAVAAAPPINTPATGVPTINGTAQVGETLTADVSSIADSDSLDNATFSYQWIGNDGSADTDIQDATGPSYTLVADDQGKTIKVRVSFSDDGGNEESLTSAATGAVAPRPPLTASFESKPSNHDGQTAFTFELRFSEEPDPDFSYQTLRDHAFTVTGGSVEKAQRLEKPSNILWRITVEPDSNAAVTVVLPITENCGDQGAVCTEDGRMLSNRLELSVGGPSQ